MAGMVGMASVASVRDMYASALEAEDQREVVNGVTTRLRRGFNHGLERNGDGHHRASGSGMAADGAVRALATANERS